MYDSEEHKLNFFKSRESHVIAISPATYHVRRNLQMSSSFTFVPRKVQAKNVKAQSTPSATGTSAFRRTGGSVNTLTETSTAALTASSSAKGKEKATENTSKSAFTEQDYVFLISMALSDYALWSDSDLRRIVEQHPERCKSCFIF